jgi:hypothetical protein
VTTTQQNQILEVSTLRAYKHQRQELRRLFYVCRESGYGVAVYVGFLERALIVAKRAVQAIEILES